MAVKGTKAKAEIIEQFAKLFGDNWIGEYNGKYYVWVEEGTEKFQIAIALTCPKVMVEGVSSAAQGKDYDFRENIPSSGSDVASPTSFSPAEITPEENAAVDELMRRLGL